MSDLRDPRYLLLIEGLKKARTDKQINQMDLAAKLGVSQSYVSKVEGVELKLDVLDLFDWLGALDYVPKNFFEDIGWFPGEDGIVPLPLKGAIVAQDEGVLQQMLWQGETRTVLLEGITTDQYLDAENRVSQLFSDLNERTSPHKNREAICLALEYAISRLPDLNPSDIYHHMVYRMYLREYHRSKPEQSWVRAGGEAMELFIERHYRPILEPHGIVVKALLSPQLKAAALKEMGLTGLVGNSKLDIALYGGHKGKPVIFGGVHSKASLAERVSDDVPCSVAMMKLGLASYLYTFDAKSFPPPHGDLVNRGELGSHAEPSDKRRYIEDHGSFDACFSYNVRTQPSKGKTRSGKKIYSSSLKPADDVFPRHVIRAWKRWQSQI